MDCIATASIRTATSITTRLLGLPLSVKAKSQKSKENVSKNRGDPHERGQCRHVLTVHVRPIETQNRYTGIHSIDCSLNMQALEANNHG